MIEAIKQLSKARKEPVWLLKARLKSWQNFLSLEMPGGDEWKYTDLSAVDLSSLDFGRSEIKIHAENAKEINNLKECLFEDDKFDALNNALFTEGVALHVKDEKVKVDIKVKDWCFVKLFFIADGDTEIEERVSGKGNAFLSCKLLVNGKTAYKYYQLFNEGLVFNHKKISISDGARLNFNFFNIGGSLSRLKAETIIGKNSSSFIKGGFIGRGEQHFNIVTNSVHEGEDSKSDVLIKGVLMDRAISAYFGSIVVDKKAPKSDSCLTSHMLLMDDARGSSIPSLKIETNDARATHSASVSQLDEEKIFYLMSRGIERKKAEVLSAKAFLKEIEEINTEEIKRIIEEKLA
jgi:Fe-S cluster assembly protein SufB